MILSFSNGSFEGTHRGLATVESSADIEKFWSERAWIKLAYFCVNSTAASPYYKTFM